MESALRASTAAGFRLRASSFATGPFLCWNEGVRSLFASLAALALVSACAPPVVTEPDGGTAGDAGPPSPARVRVTTFNVRLFFDTVCESGQCAAGDFEQVSTQAAFDARADQIATVIEGFDADVVVLQELETQACLDALAARLGDVFPAMVLGEIGTPGSVDVAVLSRRGFRSVTGHRATALLFRPDGTRTSFSRELLEVEIEHVAPLVVFAAHFRSKSNDDPGRRLAEAQVSRELARRTADAKPDALVVLAGDLNDTPGSPPLEALEANEGLLRVAAELPADQQATYVFNGRGEAIDHVLEASTPSRFLPGSSKVDRLARSFSGSDHWPLSADFLLSPQ